MSVISYRIYIVGFCKSLSVIGSFVSSDWLLHFYDVTRTIKTFVCLARDESVTVLGWVNIKGDIEGVIQ